MSAAAERDDLDETAEYLTQRSETIYNSILEELGIAPFSLNGYVVAGVENNHYYLWIQPNIFVPNGFVSVKERLGSPRADQFQNENSVIAGKYRAAIASDLVDNNGGQILHLGGSTLVHSISVIDPTFSLIRNREIRKILISDFRDLQGCLENGLWKPAVVLAGSIIEAVIFDFLVSEGVAIEDISNVTLGGLISRAKDKSVINEKTEKISSAIKDYRNLIHPGRSVADGLSAEQATAEIASSLLSLVLDDISKLRMASSSSRATDVLNAILSDQSKIHIAKFLISPLPSDEIAVLLLELIPEALIDKYSTSDLETDDTGAALLGHFFHVVFQESSYEVQTRVAQRYVEVLKDEPELVVSVHSNSLFNVGFLLCLDGEAKNIVKEHMKGRFNTGKLGHEDLPQYESISYYFDQTEIFDILQIFFRSLGSAKTDSRAREFADWIVEEHDTYCDDAQKAKIKELAEGWGRFFTQENNRMALGQMSALKRRLGIPPSSYAFDEEPF
jgi:hypothetical protein